MSAGPENRPSTEGFALGCLPGLLFALQNSYPYPQGKIRPDLAQLGGQEPQGELTGGRRCRSPRVTGSCPRNRAGK